MTFSAHRTGWRCCLLLVTSIGLLPSVVNAAESQRRQPLNIVFLQNDSMDGRVMGCMGHPAMKHATPNLDALARRGVLFRNAYTNNPICCPARASMWSGRYTFHCEGWNNYKGLNPGAPTFQTRLEEVGYRVQTFGKTDYLSGRHTIRARVSAWTRSAGIELPNYNEPAPVVLPGDKRDVHAKDWQLIRRGVAWLKEARKSPDQPFLLYVGLGIPHPVFRTSEYYYDKIPEVAVTLPPDDQYDHPVMRYQRAVKAWKHGFSPEMVRKVRRTYFAMVAEFDAMLGELLAALDEPGLRENTCVIVASDHGENAMEHQQWYKMNLYESSARIPLLVAGPGFLENHVVQTPVSLIDIYPTLMDLAGRSTPPGLDGHSLWPELTGRASSRPDWVLSEYHDTTCNTGSFMLRRGPWKYIAYVGYEPMLFDLAGDPDEVRNLASAHPEVVREMDAQLRKIVDYPAIDAKVKAYDRESFSHWRAETKAKGQYEQTMARIFSGWDHVRADDMRPWTTADEARIQKWLADK